MQPRLMNPKILDLEIFENRTQSRSMVCIGMAIDDMGNSYLTEMGAYMINHGFARFLGTAIDNHDFVPARCYIANYYCVTCLCSITHGQKLNVIIHFSPPFPFRGKHGELVIAVRVSSPIAGVWAHKHKMLCSDRS